MKNSTKSRIFLFSIAILLTTFSTFHESQIWSFVRRNKFDRNKISGRNGEVVAVWPRANEATFDSRLRQRSAFHAGRRKALDQNSEPLELHSQNAAQNQHTKLAMSDEHLEPHNRNTELQDSMSIRREELERIPYLRRHSRAKSFLIVFMGHSGSTAFSTELHEHSDLIIESFEPLDHGKIEINTTLALQRGKELMESGIAKGKIPGFKMRPLHILNQPEAWKKFVRDYDCRIIWQYRENLIKKAVGEYRNRYLNDTSVIEGLRRGQKPCEKGTNQICTFRIENMKFFVSLLNGMTISDDLLSNAVRGLERDKDLLVVNYENYLYHRERTMRETFDFLGVDWQSTVPQRIKASPDNLCIMVTNFQDLCDKLFPCQLWRPFLEDELNNCRCKPVNWSKFDSSYCKRDVQYQK